MNGTWVSAPSINAPVALRLTDRRTRQINGENIGKGKSRLLHAGNEIAFGAASPQPPDRATQDYREWRT